MTTFERPQSALPPELDETVVRRVCAGENLVAVFCQRAQEVGMHVQLTSPDSVGSDLAAILLRVKEPRALARADVSACVGTPVRPDADRAPRAATIKVVVEPALFCREEIEKALSDRAEVLDPHTGDEAMYAADIGVTGVSAAVAETGSLVCASGEGSSRAISLIPPMHVAIVRAGQIVPDLLDLFVGLSAAELPSNLTLISGPSKTADIEGILITGVHGPGEVFVLVVNT